MITDTACHKKKNIDERNYGKLQKYQQLAFEFREGRPGFRKEIVTIVIGCIGGGMKKVKAQIRESIQTSEMSPTDSNESGTNFFLIKLNV